MEYVDLYDNLGQKCHLTIGKDEVHRRALVHRGVCVWIINSKREILLQTRSSHVMFPNMLDISFSGHIQAGESSLEAAIREGREELGVELDQDKLQYLFTCREYGGVEGYFENEIDDVFLYRTDIPVEAFTFCDDEVQAMSYISVDEFKNLVEAQSERLVPYETHYQFLLTVLNSRLVNAYQSQKRG